MAPGHLTQKTPQTHANQEGQIFVFTLITPVKLPWPSRMCISEKPSESEGCHFTEAMCAVPLLQGGAGRGALGKPRGWTQGRWPRKSAEFLLLMLKNEESNAELKGLDVDSLVIEHTLPLGCAAEFNGASGLIHPCESAPATLRCSSLKRRRSLLNQRGGCTEEKDILEHTKTYGHQ
ncbi:hypothetical protein HPG69_009073 [Diceros bicornis minor]|uniref:60S ribosomal protein L17 n=1 Tax=Diceros bicornis minor TaxID=77932 RepID=A0A7J7EBF6_DICBM|nr:hypothetical protein HPG69_009073 [Diceros bicornis minor]